MGQKGCNDSIEVLKEYMKRIKDISEVTFSYVKISDYFDLSKEDALIEELKGLDYHDSSYILDSEKEIISFIVPRNGKKWSNQRSELLREKRFIKLIKEYGSEKSKRNK